jgi:hypothetical protein
MPPGKLLRERGASSARSHIFLECEVRSAHARHGTLRRLEGTGLRRTRRLDVMRSPVIPKYSGPHSGPGGMTMHLASARPLPTTRCSRSRQYCSSPPRSPVWSSGPRPSAGKLLASWISWLDAKAPTHGRRPPEAETMLHECRHRRECVEHSRTTGIGGRRHSHCTEVGQVTRG